MAGYRNLQAELVKIRSQMDRVKLVVQNAEQLWADDEEIDRQWMLETLLGSLNAVLNEDELTEVSPALAKLLKEGRVS